MRGHLLLWQSDRICDTCSVGMPLFMILATLAMGRKRSCSRSSPASPPSPSRSSFDGSSESRRRIISWLKVNVFGHPPSIQITVHTLLKLSSIWMEIRKLFSIFICISHLHIFMSTQNPLFRTGITYYARKKEANMYFRLILGKSFNTRQLMGKPGPGRRMCLWRWSSAAWWRWVPRPRRRRRRRRSPGRTGCRSWMSSPFSGWGKKLQKCYLIFLAVDFI